MDRQALINPFKPADRGTQARSSLASVVKSTKLYVDRADTNRSRGAQSFPVARQTTERSSGKGAPTIEAAEVEDSPDNVVKQLIMKASTKSRER